MRCCVPFCDQSSENLFSKKNSEKKEVTFHEIPTSQCVRLSWLESIGLNESHLPEGAMICSQHFQEDDFNVTECGSVELKKNSVPTVFRLKSNSVTAAVHVCMVCLDTASELYPFTKYVAQAYSSITGLSNTLIGEINSEPKLCTECTRRLINCNKFRVKSLSAYNLLFQLYKKYGMLTLDNINTINRMGYQLPSNIGKHVIQPDHCDFYFKENLKEGTNIQEEHMIYNSPQYAEVKIETNEDFVSITKLKDESIDFDIDNEADCDENDIYNDVKNNDIEINDRRADMKCLDDDIDHDINNDHGVDFLNDYESCVKFLNENVSKQEDTKKYINIVTVINKNGKDVPKKNNENAVCQTNVKHKKDVKPIKTRNSRKINIPVKDRAKTAKSIKKRSCKRDKICENIKKYNGNTNKKLVPNDVKTPTKQRRKPAKAKKASALNEIKTDIEASKNLKTEAQDCGDLKCFAITVLSYEEQLDEIQKRKETDGYSRSPYKCTVCYKSYWHNEPYNRHMEKHTNKYGQLECAICGLHKKTRTNLRKHIKSFHDVKFTCKSCPFVSNDRTQAHAHEQWHNGKKYRCPHCEAEFTKRSSYLSHVRIKHPSDCVCALCGFSFVSEKGLQCHRNMAHRFDEQHNLDGPQCEECVIRFATVAAYEQHMKVSPKHATAGTLKRNEPQYRLLDPSSKREADAESGGTVLCELCGKSFRWPAQLQQHMQVHTGEKLFKCDACDKRFMHKLTLALHAQSHGDAPARYECAVCGKSFTHYSNRHRHMMSHRDSRPYHKCAVCHKEFTTAQGRNAHVAHVHGNVPRPRRLRGARRGPRASHTRPTHAVDSSEFRLQQLIGDQKETNSD